MLSYKNYTPDKCFFILSGGEAIATITVICDDIKKEGYIHMVACHEDFRGRGYASKGLEIFIPFIMNRLGINEIYGICLSQNIASRRVLEKCGFMVIRCADSLLEDGSPGTTWFVIAKK